jgi:NAD(P)-dependent dehydrogenase (short-subunit alcohol dehydrogenase family)
VALLARSTEQSPGRLPGTLEETAREVQAVGGRALCLAADVRREQHVRAAVDRALVAFDHIDVLVTNAAAFHGAAFHEIPLSRWDLVLDVNLRGAVVCAQAVIPSMIEHRSGHILNVSSEAAVGFYPEMASYAVSKAALENLTQYLAVELAPYCIAANALRIDGAVATEGAILLNPKADYSGWLSPEEVARAALWLVSQPRAYSGRLVAMSELLREIADGVGS